MRNISALVPFIQKLFSSLSPTVEMIPFKNDNLKTPFNNSLHEKTIRIVLLGAPVNSTISPSFTMVEYIDTLILSYLDLIL